MNILMLSEYFTPYDFGGSEWSTYYLAKGLSKKGFQITVLTPNYGELSQTERLDGFEVYRFPFYKKMKTKRQLTPFWFTNMFWVIWTSFFTLKACLKNKIDIIHVQGKYFLPAATLCKFFLRKKVIITLRDYIILCPLGLCFLRGSKSCNLIGFFLKDISQYKKNYLVKNNFFSTFMLLLASINARLVSFWLRFLLIFVDQIVAVSDLAKRIYMQNGVRRIIVIDNPFHLEDIKKYKKENKIIFAGRLSPGKGPAVLIKAIPRILQRNPNLSFLFFGEGFLKSKLLKMTKDVHIESRVRFLGHIPHKTLLHYLAIAKIVVIPSVWPEPFGRLALESLMVGTPIVISNRAGFSEHVKDHRWGIVKPPNSEEIAQGINYVLANLPNLEENIQKDRQEIKIRWTEDVYNSYSEIYKKLLS